MIRRPTRPGLTGLAIRLARPVRLFVLDVDGVLTDNAAYFRTDGPGTKRFFIQDSMGLKLCQRAGIEIAVISGLDNLQARQFTHQLGVTEFHGGHRDKLPVLMSLLEARGLDLHQVAYMGDDWLDASVMARVGLPMAPCDAQPEILRLARFVAKRPGGNGAVRDAVRLLLTARGVLTDLWRQLRD